MLFVVEISTKKTLWLFDLVNVITVLIVEVASKSTKNYDRVDKFDYYCSLPSFQEYLLVEQCRWRVLQHLRQEGDRWLLSDFETQNDVITLASLNLPLASSDIYAGVDFTLSEEGTDIRNENTGRVG
ncbi:Uma2 family endonuclease [Baaleninema sp.]|uniref:Uma2 family endonuclease n=1 Tax=Baaleninema sp. TaxID=3101197 RepID=UPI003D083945